MGIVELVAREDPWAYINGEVGRRIEDLAWREGVAIPELLFKKEEDCTIVARGNMLGFAIAAAAA